MLRGADDQLAFVAARGMDQRTLDAPEFHISRGVVERVAREGKPQVTSDAQSDEWLSARSSVVIFGLRSILCVPLQFKGTTIGVIYVDSRLQAGIFLPADLELLTAIAASAAIAIENARLYRLAVDKGYVLGESAWLPIFPSFECVTGHVSVCRPRWLSPFEPAVLQVAGQLRTRSFRDVLADTAMDMAEIVRPVSSAITALPYPWPVSCSTVCQGKVDVFVRTCCCR